MALKPVSDYVPEAKNKKKEIEDEFITSITANPAAAVALVQARNARIQREVYEAFENRRKGEYDNERDINSLHLTCRAGRGSPFGSVPRDSSSGTVARDSEKWENVSSENQVEVHNSLAGEHSVQIDEIGFAFVNFAVTCKGVAFEDTTRGHGAHDATLHASFKLRPDSLAALVADDRRALEREVGT